MVGVGCLCREHRPSGLLTRLCRLVLVCCSNEFAFRWCGVGRAIASLSRRKENCKKKKTVTVVMLTTCDDDRGGGGRSTAQAIALKEHLPVDMVMNLDVPRQVIMDRLTDRWIHPGSGRVYAYAYRPPKVCWFRFSREVIKLFDLALCWYFFFKLYRWTLRLLGSPRRSGASC